MQAIAIDCSEFNGEKKNIVLDAFEKLTGDRLSNYVPEILDLIKRPIITNFHLGKAHDDATFITDEYWEALWGIRVRFDELMELADMDFRDNGNPTALEKLKGKPDWSLAPKWVKYQAMNSDGDWWWFETEPFLDHWGDWCSHGGKMKAIYHDDKWVNSVEKRPK